MPRKPKLGQNFLTDAPACLRIAQSLGDTSLRTVVEIGPGHGAITDLLAPRAATLHCIEFDSHLARELTFRFRNTPHVTIHHADILHFDLATLTHETANPDQPKQPGWPIHARSLRMSGEHQQPAPPTSEPPQPCHLDRSGEAAERRDPLPAHSATDPGGPNPGWPIHADSLIVGMSGEHQPPAPPTPPTLDIIGNLPYYITSDILLHLFRFARLGFLARAVLMMQREVADRIAAQPGSSLYGPLSAFTQLHAQVTNLFTLPPSSFTPPPDVHSIVLRLDFAPRFTELGIAPTAVDNFNAFLRSTFAQKRKTLANNLRAAGYTPAQLTTAWPDTIPPTARSEAIPLDSLATLYRNLHPTL